MAHFASCRRSFADVDGGCDYPRRGERDLPMLALAAPAFNTASETFVRDHVRHIAPKQTILLCQDGTDAERLGCPVLSDLRIRRSRRGKIARVGEWLATHLQNPADSELSAIDRLRVKAFFRTYQPTALLAEFGPIGCLLMGVARELDVPLYVHFHGHDATAMAQDPHHAELYRKLFFSAAGVIAPSRYLLARLADLGCPLEKLALSPCGVDPSCFVPTNGQSSQVIVAVGRMVEKKAPHLTIEAFSKVCDQFPDARLEMIGTGPLFGRCKKTIQRLGLESKVVLHGLRDHDFVAEVMGRSAMFVQHSVVSDDGDAEGMPVSVMEAMASALPVVATRHSGIPETVLENTCGLLVEEHDVDGMAGAIAKLLADPILAAKLGAAGRGRILGDFTHQHTGARLRAILGSSAVVPSAR